MKKICLFALFMASGLAGYGDAAEPLDINVMSFNIRCGNARDGENHWDKRKGQVFDVIRRHSPDVVGLQEALRFQIDEVRKNLPEYGEIGIGRDGGQEGEYSVILYRTGRFKVEESGTFWLSDTPAVPSIHWGNACIRICTWSRFVDANSRKAFYIYNTHLDHISQPSREKSVRLIMDVIGNRKHPDPFVLIGDFNADEKNPAIQYLKGAGDAAARSPVHVADTFRMLHPDEVEAGTFNAFQGKSAGGKIDYIFVGPDTRVLLASIVRDNRDGCYPSDHFPITARLRLVANPAPEVGNRKKD